MKLFMRQLSLWAVMIIAILCFGFTTTLFAQDDAIHPPQAAENARQALFNAQVALLTGNTENALASVEQAQAYFDATLRAPLAETVPQALGGIEAQFAAQFATLTQAANAGDANQLAAARGQWWAALLNASAEVVYASLETGDTDTAALWLPLRDFRPSTRFSRPGADATLAIRNLANGDIEIEAAIASVRADLLDTYQAQLNASLVDLDDTVRHGFPMRSSEEAGLAAGYFNILAPFYSEQRGDDALVEMQASFDQLLTAAKNGDISAVDETRQAITTALMGFRAAPLSEAEIVRRAGQLSRFITLVPIEYERGVRNGVVIADIEIQEAITFHQGAAAAFADLQGTLSEIDPEATARVSTLLAGIPAQIRAVDEPANIRAVVDEISALLTATIPPEWLASSAGSDIDVILSVLDQVITAVQQDEYTLAESARLEAYALLELGLEQRLVGFAPDMAIYIESLFWQGTSEEAGLAVLLAQRAPLVEIRANISSLNTAFGEARLLLDSARSAPEAVIGNAAIIVFREGLEAVLILASLLASLRTAEEMRFRRPLIGGAALAFLATAITWVLANSLLNVLLPLGERLEAIVSLIAIGVLLVITNWFFHKVYWTGWMANFHAQKRRLIGGVVTVSVSQTLGLVLLGFTSIYREGFETVLFLQSLVLEAGIGIVLQGVVLGLIATSIVGVITFALQVRLPYKKMLVVTGVMIGGVLLVMVGNTVHVMQVVGWMPIHPIQGVFFPYWMGQWFGIFATWEGIILQFAAAAFVIGSYFIAERQQKQKRTQSRGKASQTAEA